MHAYAHTQAHRLLKPKKNNPYSPGFKTFGVGFSLLLRHYLREPAAP